MSTNPDIIVLGAGPGGYRAAHLAATRGLRVVVIEEGPVGGTCLNEGCIPTKSYAHHAAVLRQLRDADALGLDGLSYRFSFAQVVNRKNQVVGQLREGIETLLAHPGIQLVRGHARFVDSHTVEAVCPDTTSPQRYAAPHIIVATGSESKVLPGMQGYITHDQLLARTTLPKRLCIIGAGVIGMEFASIFATFGTEVTVVEYLKECLPALDSDIAKRLRKSLEKQGVVFHMQCAVTSVTPGTQESPARVTFADKKQRQLSIEADEVLMAVGRRPRVGEELRAAGFAFDERTGIAVDEHLQTTVPGIYAIGDVNGRQMLAHAAEMQASYVVDHILSQRAGTPCHRPSPMSVPMPAAIFTLPEAACVGLSEDQCREQGRPYQCHKAFHRANGKALAMCETEGMLKLLTDADGLIVGCHAFGAHAADLVQEASVLMCRHTTIDQLRQMVHIHPTLSEILLAAAEA